MIPGTRLEIITSIAKEEINKLTKDDAEVFGEVDKNESSDGLTHLGICWK